MSAPERFQVGDTVRCVDDNNVDLRVGRTYTVTKVDGECGDVQVDERRYWFSSSRFVLVSRPTPSALDPFAWTDLAGLRIKSAPFITAWVAWSRFCYWAAQSNLAAHFLPTVAAARTRASNGRDVPVAYVDVRLPVDAVGWYAEVMAEPTRSDDYPGQVGAACRRALGAS